MHSHPLLKNELLSTIRKAISAFDDSITIAEPESHGSLKYLKKNTGGYVFNQRKMLNLIDLYDNSKFETGPTDSEGQRKLFLNIGTFRRKVASKQIRLGVKDYTFIPDNYESIWKTWFMARQFKVWSRDNGMGELINELEETYPKYGHMVVKRVGKKLERVPIRNLINPQDCKTLKDAFLNGQFVIETHEYTEHQLKQFKDWKTDHIDVEEGEKIKVYECYGFVEREIVDDYNGKESEDETMVPVMAIVTCDDTGEKKNDGILYLQEISKEDFPYEEEAWDKQDGRWLGIGEIENQLENQIARNSSANLRRRAMLWASKKLFQSTDEAVQRNLIKEVKDGQVMNIAPNGNITPIDMSTRALPDFNADDSMWEQNSNQKSFTFEVATGESLPSGTPFRLGAMLESSVSTHFQRMKEKFGLFLIRAYFNQLIPIFKKQTKDHTISIAGSEEGVGHLIDALKQYVVWDQFKQVLLSGQVPVLADIERQASELMAKQKYHFIDIPDKFYDDAKFHMELDITGQAVDTKQEIETFTNIFLAASKNPAVLQDRNMIRLLEMIVSRTGKTLKDFMGEMKAQPQAPQMSLPPNAQTQQAPTGIVQ